MVSEAVVEVIALIAQQLGLTYLIILSVGWGVQ